MTYGELRCLRCGMAGHVSASCKQPLPEAKAAEDDIEIRVGRLSPRQVEVLQMRAKGLSEEETAAALSLTQLTVHTMMQRIRKRLEVNSASEAVYLMLRAEEIDKNRAIRRAIDISQRMEDGYLIRRILEPFAMTSAARCE